MTYRSAVTVSRRCLHAKAKSSLSLVASLVRMSNRLNALFFTTQFEKVSGGYLLAGIMRGVREALAIQRPALTADTRQMLPTSVRLHSCRW